MACVCLCIDGTFVKWIYWSCKKDCNLNHTSGFCILMNNTPAYKATNCSSSPYSGSIFFSLNIRGSYYLLSWNLIKASLITFYEFKNSIIRANIWMCEIDENTSIINEMEHMQHFFNMIQVRLIWLILLICFIKYIFR